MLLQRSARRSPFMRSMCNTIFATCGRPPHWLAKPYNSFEALIRGEVPNLPKSLSSPHGNVAKKTIVSVSFLQFGLQRLSDLTTPMDYTFANLLSCLTLDVENCHSVVHHKSPLWTVLKYARNFGHTVKESVKKTMNWVAFYFTNPKSWYPLPDRAASLFEIPLAPQISPAVISSQDAQLMKEWAHTFGVFRLSWWCFVKICSSMVPNPFNELSCIAAKHCSISSISTLQRSWYKMRIVSASPLRQLITFGQISVKT